MRVSEDARNEDARGMTTLQRAELAHHWAGCQRERCGQPRDAEHDWAGVSCRLTCRRCGLVHDVAHDWQGCVCRACGETNHDWCGSVCLKCGKTRVLPPCRWTLPISPEDVPGSGWTAHGGADHIDENESKQ